MAAFNSFLDFSKSVFFLWAQIPLCPPGAVSKHIYIKFALFMIYLLWLTGGVALQANQSANSWIMQILFRNIFTSNNDELEIKTVSPKNSNFF